MSDMQLPSIDAMLQSPPITPQAEVKEEAGRQASPSDDHSKDPQLFPNDNSADASQTSLPLARPLFADERDILPGVDQHIAKRRKTSSQQVIPKREEYELVARTQHSTFTKYNRDPQAYILEELRKAMAYPARFPQPASTRITRRSPSPERPMTTRRNRVWKATVTVTKIPRSRRIRRSPNREFDAPKDEQDTTLRESIEVQDLPVKKERQAVKPRAPKVRKGTPGSNDEDFDSVPDYCPPLSTLGDNPKALKCAPAGVPIDLTNDPNRHLLHPAELLCASSLRLSAGRYLKTKRRIFKAYREMVLAGNPNGFNKTHAQQAVTCDVNKGSKLHEAFAKAGWFNPKYMTPYI